jgi:hypothetical protein
VVAIELGLEHHLVLSLLHCVHQFRRGQFVLVVLSLLVRLLLFLVSDFARQGYSLLVINFHQFKLFFLVVNGLQLRHGVFLGL